MRDRLTSFAACIALLALALPGCSKEEETPVANQPTQNQQQYQQQPYQPAAAQPAAAQPAAAQPAAAQPAAAQPAAAAPASPTPSPLATVCTSDGGCVGAKCNIAAGKCQFPCASNNDCQPGWACNLQLGQLCVPTGQVAK